MTDREFDTMLRAALLDAQLRRWEPVTESGPDLEWTPARQKIMDRILADPFGYGKRRARPRWRRTLGRVGQLAACLLLVGAIAYTTVPTARAWVDQTVQMVVEWLATNTRFRFQGEAQGELGDWRPEYMVEGYEEVDVFDFAGSIEVTYEDEQGNQISFNYMLVESGAMHNFDNEHSDVQEMELNGQPAQLFVTNTEGWPSHLIWFDETGQISYYLMADIPTEEILKIAQSIALQ